MGITYWDTANGYAGGNSEAAMGKHFQRFPQDRKRIFLVTKAKSSVPEEMSTMLNASFERLKTDYIDLFFIHGISDVDEEVNKKEIKAWAEKAKSQGKIRFFGFSTHKNMAMCLTAAAKLGWIDGIMSSYNYRLMQMDDMKRAVDACVKAGIGLTAMKTQAPFMSGLWAELGSRSDAAEKFAERFIKKGFSPEQAKLKAVWENPQIASVCSEMPNMTILMANIAAAHNKTKLTLKDKAIIEQYANATASGYCTGCAKLCESTLYGNIPVSDIMRSLMYYDQYNNNQKAMETFRNIPATTRADLLKIDYADAEKVCPQKMPIEKLMKDAVAVLSGLQMSSGSV